MPKCNRSSLNLLNISIVIFLLTFPFLLTCGGGGGDGDKESSEGASIEATGTVGQDGGTVEVTDPGSPLDGVMVEIPEGALDDDALITIETVDEVPPTPDVFNPIGPTVKLGPSDTSFNEPVTITIPIDPNTIPSHGQILLLIFNKSENRWEYVPSFLNIEKGTISGIVTHFTDAQAVELKLPPKEYTWRITNFPSDTNGFSQDQILEAVDRAFKNWESEISRAGITFEQETDPLREADIKISWTNIIPFIGGVDVCTATFEEFIKGLLGLRIFCRDTLSEDKHWAALPEEAQFRSFNQFDIEQIITHEIGHLLGINHLSELDSPPIMAAAYCSISIECSTKRAFHMLVQEDIEALASLYNIPPPSPDCVDVAGTWSGTTHQTKIIPEFQDFGFVPFQYNIIQDDQCNITVDAEFDPVRTETLNNITFSGLVNGNKAEMTGSVLRLQPGFIDVRIDSDCTITFQEKELSGMCEWQFGNLIDGNFEVFKITLTELTGTFVPDGIPSTPVPTAFPDELSDLDDACIENVDITINGQRFTNGVGDYDVDPKQNPNDIFSTAHIAIKVDSLCFGDGVEGQAFSFLVGNDLHILWECVPSDGFGGAICGEDFLVTAPSSGVRHFSGDRGTEFDVLIFTQDCFPCGTLALPDCIFP